MKRICILLTIAWGLQSFCLLVEQSPVAAQSSSFQIEDSDLFLQTATRPARPNRDYSREVESLLSQMTLEKSWADDSTRDWHGDHR